MKKVYSFDVFDTCLVRLCGTQENLFEVLSQKVLAKMGEQGDEQMRRLFVATRSGTGGLNLEEIYRNMANRFPLPCSVEEMVKLEMQTEQEMLVPIEATRKLIESLRPKGMVVFVSDMYLPENFIRTQLNRHGFFIEGDLLYVSNAAGARKDDGTLFRLIHEQMAIEYRNWCHFGDNQHSDFKIPRKLGIKAHWLHYDYLPYEKKWTQEVCALGYQFPSLLAGVCRATRLASVAPSCQSAFVADISAPIVAAWVFEVMRDAQRRGIRRLYFFARDAHSFFLVARKLQRFFPQVEAKYLFISRQSLYYDNPCRIKFFEQEGLASTDQVGIVDVSSTGKTVRVLNELLRQNGYRPVEMSYCLFGLSTNNGEEGGKAVGCSNDHVSNCISQQYIATSANAVLKRLPEPIVFIEAAFSLNYHGRTGDYCQRGSCIRPVFVNDEETPWALLHHNERVMKKSNDVLLNYFVDALSVVQLFDYSPEVLERIAIPNLAEFIHNPNRVYLDYLHLFQFYGVSYVDKCWKKNIWKRGSKVFSFSPRVLKLLSFLKEL